MLFTVHLLFPQVIFLSLPLVMCRLFSQAFEEVNSPNTMCNFFVLHSVMYERLQDPTGFHHMLNFHKSFPLNVQMAYVLPIKSILVHMPNMMTCSMEIRGKWSSVCYNLHIII